MPKFKNTSKLSDNNAKKETEHKTDINQDVVDKNNNKQEFVDVISSNTTTMLNSPHMTSKRTKSPATEAKRPTSQSLSRSTTGTGSRPTSNTTPRHRYDNNYSKNNNTSKKKSNKLQEGQRSQVTLLPPDNSELLACKDLDNLQVHLREIAEAIKQKTHIKQRKVEELLQKAVLPFQQRRAQNEAAEAEPIISQYKHNIKRINVMEEQVVEYKALRDRVFAETKRLLEEEVAQLEEQQQKNEPTIRAGYMDRINLLQRYWPWRRLHDLGDTKVGKTFAEELARGPRFRNVAIQNNIQSEYIEKQIKWLEGYVNRESLFRQRLRTLDNLVEDLSDVNELLESALTCSVCGLLFEDPVIFWPCGHTFCLECFHSLAIAPSLFRCSICGSIGSEGYVHNLLIADTVAKWMFKDSGYRDVDGPLNAIRTHMIRFQKENLVSRLQMLREIRLENLQRIAADPSQNSITFLDRPY